MTERRKDLLRNGFKQIPLPPDAPGVLTILEKTHNSVLREQHWLNIHPSLPGKHERFVEVLNADLLNRLSSGIRAASKEALAENKKNVDYNPREAGKTQYGMAQMERWHGRVFGKQAANKKLAAMMLKYQALVRAIQVYDPLAPTTPAFSLEPLRGTWATSKRQAAYLKFLNAITLADDMLERAGAPRGTRSLTPDEQRLAERMRRRGKGTERGSVRFIADELRERGNRKKRATLIQGLKRHFRRKSQ